MICKCKFALTYFRAAVLNSSPRTPPLCTFRMLLLSLQTFVLFKRKCPAKWTSQNIPPWFQFEANVYIPVHWSVRVVNFNCIYLQRYMIVRAWRKSANPRWMNVPKWSKLQRIFPAQGVGSNGHCVNQNTLHARSALLTSWLSESGVLKREMQNMLSGEARGLELRTATLEQKRIAVL